MSQTFHAQNPLEQAMIDANRDEAAQPALLELLMNAEVGVLLDKPLLENGRWNPEASPLVLNRPAGFPALAIFTSPIRSLDAALHSETYQHGTAMPLRQLLRGVQPALGLVVNPSALVGFDLTPQQVADLKKAFGVETASAPQ